MKEAKGSILRGKIAKQIMDSRRLERGIGGYMETNRNGNDYRKYFLGLARLLDYVRTFEDPAVLDIGAGTTKGISEIANSEEGMGIQFFATVLRKTPQIKQYLGNERTLIAPAETLEGVNDDAVAAVLALQSITYSVAPEMVIDSIDRILKSGGVLKAIFPLYSDRRYPFNVFEPFLRQKGYDICSDQFWSKINMIVAIKPGGNIGAEELMDKDREAYWNALDRKERLRKKAPAISQREWNWA